MPATEPSTLRVEGLACQPRGAHGETPKGAVAANVAAPAGKSHAGDRLGVADLPQAQAVRRGDAARDARSRARRIAAHVARRALRPWPDLDQRARRSSAPSAGRRRWRGSRSAAGRRPRSSQRSGEHPAHQDRRLGALGVSLRAAAERGEVVLADEAGRRRAACQRDRAASARARSSRRGTGRARPGSAPCSGSGGTGPRSGRRSRRSASSTSRTTIAGPHSPLTERRSAARSSASGASVVSNDTT